MSKKNKNKNLTRQGVPNLDKLSGWGRGTPVELPPEPLEEKETLDESDEDAMAAWAHQAWLEGKS